MILADYDAFITQLELPPELSNALIQNFIDQKKDHYYKNYRESILYGGRYSEVMVRILEYITNNGKYLPLNTPIPSFHNTCNNFRFADKNKFDDSIRYQIPKALDLIYDIRNRRNVGHISNNIKENEWDSQLCLTLSSWTFCELLRIFKKGEKKIETAIQNIMRNNIPIVQNFDGYYKL
jgi:hypothetical protein